jgi:hypothetical protein
MNLLQRGIRHTTLPALALTVAFATARYGFAEGADDPNVLTEAEKKAGFELLFDGKGLDGWEQKGNWVVREGAIFRAERGGGLTYSVKMIPDDFELRFQWKVAEGSNSGVYYRPGQYEYQILDNQVHRDGRNPRTSAASLYFCIAPSKDVTKPVGQWNCGRVVCKGSVVQHWLNGEKVIDLDYCDPKYAADVERLRIRGADLAARGRHLFLQDHGDPVWYRGIKLRALGEEDVLDRTPVEPQAIPDEALKYEQEVLDRIQKRGAKVTKKKPAGN